MNFKFSKVKDTPLNRDGETSEPTFTGTEGDLIGLTENVDQETIAVHADAASGTAQPAMGVLLEEVRDRSYWSANLHDNGTMSRQLDAAYDINRTQPGDEVTYVRYGIYLEDVDDETDFTPNEPVYLAVGGGVTQTAPSGAGDLVQRLGTAVDAETFYLDVRDAEVIDEESGSATFSGDSTGGVVTFNISHNLGVAPSEYNVEATSADAAGDYYVTPTDTSLDVTFSSAPADGTDNVSFGYTLAE